MADKTRPGAGSTAGADQKKNPALRNLLAVRARIESGFAAAINSALNAAGLRISVQSPPPPVVSAPPVAPVGNRAQGGAPRPFPPADFTAVPAPPIEAKPAAPLRTFPPAKSEAAVSKTAQLASALLAFSKNPLSQTPLLSAHSTVPVTPAKPVVRGPTPVQVMSAVQNAVVGAVNVVSGTIAGVGAARDAAVAVAKTATGAASVAGGMATVASGFFPQLAALGIGVPKAPKAPKNRPGMPPQRRVADIIANPLGKSPPPGAPAAGGPPLPTRRVKRIPLVRAKSSLEMSRKEKTRKRRSYEDLQMKPQIGLTPHEVLLKVATLALGKTLLGLLEAGARGQQRALQRASERMSQKQVMLLGMLPAQYIVQKLPQQSEVPVDKSQAHSSEQVERPAAGKPGGTFKIRY